MVTVWRWGETDNVSPRQEIARGALPAGEPINQEELARTMGISVTPLREALRRLAAEGFIVRRAP